MKKIPAKVYNSDIFCPRPLTKSKLLTSRVEKYVNKKMSVEYLVRKMDEIDKLKFVLFSDDELTVFKFIQNPNLIPDKEAKSKIEDLWIKTEFHEKVDLKDFERMKELISTDEVSEKMTKILSLI